MHLCLWLMTSRREAGAILDEDRRVFVVRSQRAKEGFALTKLLDEGAERCVSKTRPLNGISYDVSVTI